MRPVVGVGKFGENFTDLISAHWQHSFKLILQQLLKYQHCIILTFKVKRCLAVQSFHCKPWERSGKQTSLKFSLEYILYIYLIFALTSDVTQWYDKQTEPDSKALQVALTAALKNNKYTLLMTANRSKFSRIYYLQTPAYTARPRLQKQQ